MVVQKVSPDSLIEEALTPFVHPDLVWDFRLPNVRSIRCSGTRTWWCARA